MHAHAYTCTDYNSLTLNYIVCIALDINMALNTLAKGIKPLGLPESCCID